MKRSDTGRWAMIVALATAGGACFAMPASAAPATLYENARVWTGSGFGARTLAVRDGRFVDPATAGPDAARVDLAGDYVVPAYANAHAHVTPATPSASKAYTDVGVFYVWNPNTIVIGAKERAFYARADAYDVKVSQGGITEPGGHPERLYVDVLTKYVYKGRKRDWFVGNAFHYGSTPAEIDRALDLLTEQGAEFVKAYLLRSERYAAAKADPKAYGARGLNPVHMPYLVARAHARGLPVAVHVETAHDLRMAAWAGADMAAHLPAYGGGRGEALEPRRIGAADAALIARSGMKVVPTYSVVRGDAYAEGQSEPKPEDAPAIAVQVENIRSLTQAGVPILIGTDGSGTIFPEAEHLVAIGASTAAETTARVFATGAALFPERRIGCFTAGCEADFLVLDADPTADIKALRTIRLRFMAGVELPALEDGAAAQSD